MAINASLPLIMTLISVGGVLFLASTSKGVDRAIVTLDACLNSLNGAEKKLKKGPDPDAEQRKHDIGVYLAEHLAATIQDPQTWERTLPDVKRNNGRERARQALERHRTRTPEEVRRAEATVGRLVDDTDVGLQKLMTPRALAALAVGLFGGTFVVVAFFGAVGALVFGNGFTFRPCGASLVNRKGQPISRIRALSRHGSIPGIGSHTGSRRWTICYSLSSTSKTGPRPSKRSFPPMPHSLSLQLINPPRDKRCQAQKRWTSRNCQPPTPEPIAGGLPLSATRPPHADASWGPSGEKHTLGSDVRPSVHLRTVLSITSGSTASTGGKASAGIVDRTWSIRDSRTFRDELTLVRRID
jgi:hypothetical protein